MRKAPPLPENLSTVRAKPFWEATFEVELLTRLFGGGVEARKLDPLCWLRPSALKSALRFWWRAAYGHLHPDLKSLRQREGELFGSPGRFENGKLKGGPGLVSVEVRSVTAPEPRSFVDPQHSAFHSAYFAAALADPPSALGLPGAVARVLLTVSALAPPSEETEKANGEALEEILTALRLWLVLGGVGSRTRRGAGAIGLRDPQEAGKLGVPQEPVGLETFLRKVCSAKVTVHPGAFLLGRTLQVFLGRPSASAVAAHESLLDAIREARQDRAHPPERRGPDGWGRSRWPEPDAIRLKVGPKRKWVHDPASANSGRYPRAALGLPIVFHFKTPPTEPANHVLTAACDTGRVRLARYPSPVILRAVRTWEGNTPQAVPVALFTRCTLPADALAVIEEEGSEQARKDVEPKDLTAYRVTSEAPATLDRVMQPFRVAARGFKTLWPLTGDPDA